MLGEYLKTRAIYYIVFVFIAIIGLFLQSIFNFDIAVVSAIIISSLTTMTILFIVNFFVIEYNFKQIRNKLNEIENPELIAYYLTRPRHYESGYIYDMLADISHNLYQKYKQNIDNQIEYQEYLLLFIHDLKLPIQNLKLTVNESCQNEIVVLESLVDNLLNYSKISLSSVDIKVTTIDLKDVVTDVIKRNFSLIFDNNIQITTDLTSVNITTDSYWLTFVVNQLIGNAIKYAKRCISITINESSSEVAIVITNDGLLIRVDELNEIFEKGFTGSNANQNATGYGLYYAHEITLKLNCALQVNINNDLNTFIITYQK